MKWGRIALVIVCALIVTALGIDAADTINVKLGNVSNLSLNKLTLTRIKSQGTKPKIQYDYNFIKL